MRKEANALKISSKPWFRPAVTGGVFIFGLVLLVTWDLYLNPKLTEVTAVVASQPILANTTITPKDLTTETILRTDQVPQAINMPTALIGRTATEHIGPGAQFSAYMISQRNLLPNGRYSTYVLPKEWVFAVPAIVRRGDHINIYTVAATQGSSQGISTIPVGRPLLSGVRVEYALDSSGQEVVNSNPNANATSAENRQNSTGTISELDVLLTKVQWQQIDQACTHGQQLIISDLNG